MYVKCLAPFPAQSDLQDMVVIVVIVEISESSLSQSIWKIVAGPPPTSLISLCRPHLHLQKKSFLRSVGYK